MPGRGSAQPAVIGARGCDGIAWRRPDGCRARGWGDSFARDCGGVRRERRVPPANGPALPGGRADGHDRCDSGGTAPHTHWYDTDRASSRCARFSITPDVEELRLYRDAIRFRLRFPLCESGILVLSVEA